jgi:hypothetical protein
VTAFYVNNILRVHKDPEREGSLNDFKGQLRKNVMCVKYNKELRNIQHILGKRIIQFLRAG